MVSSPGLPKVRLKDPERNLSCRTSMVLRLDPVREVPRCKLCGQWRKFPPQAMSKPERLGGPSPTCVGYQSAVCFEFNAVQRRQEECSGQWETRMKPTSPT